MILRRSLRAVRFGVAAGVLATSALASPIDDKYDRLGGAGGFLGAATSAELTAPDNTGKFRHYSGGSIYWHPSTDAYAVRGLIRKRWTELGAERSDLGYPMTDEIDTFDRAGRVSKFQGGELIWRRSTNAVSEVKSTDLIIDWPFPAGQAWRITQANARPVAPRSHVGPWAYCWDITIAGQHPSAADGMPFVSVADGRVAHVDEHFPSGILHSSNVTVLHLGTGRYASYLHTKQGNYTRRFAAAKG